MVIKKEIKYREKILNLKGYALGIALLTIYSIGYSQTSSLKDTNNTPLLTLVDEFGFSSIEKRVVDNKGRGDERFSGVRNFRVVLYDILYRGGGNNLHLKDTIPKYYLWNPMPLYSLRQLQSQGFNQATYLYSHNFDYWYPKHRLDSLREAEFSYKCEPKLDVYLKAFFGEVVVRAKQQDTGKMLIHCWNGWHQAGMLSAFTLMQFCDFTNEQALKYWETCTDGNHKGYTKVKERILNYTRDPFYNFNASQKESHCPCQNEIMTPKEQQEDDIVNLSEDEMMEKEIPVNKVHIVRNGDSLSSISLAYGTSIEKIKSTNNLISDTIMIDQKLIIP